MVKKLLRGERRMSLLQLLMMVAVLCGLFVGGFLIHSYKTRWEHAQRISVRVCQARNDQTLKLQGLEKADIALQQGLITIEQSNQFVDAKIRARRIALFTAKLKEDEKFLATTPPNCHQLLP